MKQTSFFFFFFWFRENETKINVAASREVGCEAHQGSSCDPKYYRKLSHEPKWKLKAHILKEKHQMLLGHFLWES